MPSRTVERGKISTLSMPSDRRATIRARVSISSTGCRATPRVRILEVGCGRGATGALALSEGCCGCYVGIKSDEGAAADAREVLTDVIAGDIETIEPAWEEAIFDVLILPESFENLVDPDAALKKLAKFVRFGGMLLASARALVSDLRFAARQVSLCGSRRHRKNLFASDCTRSDGGNVGRGRIRSRRNQPGHAARLQDRYRVEAHRRPV